MVEVHTFPDEAATRAAATEAVSSVLSARRDKPVLFFVSGGSGFDVLNILPDTLCDGSTTVSVIDERFSTDPAVNNFLQLQKTEFYKKASGRGVHFIQTVPKDGESKEDMAKRFEADITGWQSEHADGVMVALIGLGRDGHTAGIIGNPDDKRSFQFMFEDDSMPVVGYDAGSRNQYPQRVTVTFPLLRKLTATVVYAVGEAKKQALSQVLAPQGELHRTPGRIILELENCHLYTDQPVDTVKKEGI